MNDLKRREAILRAACDSVDMALDGTGCEAIVIVFSRAGRYADIGSALSEDDLGEVLDQVREKSRSGMPTFHQRSSTVEH